MQIQLRAVLLLATLLTGGCDDSHALQPADCDTSPPEQAASSNKAFQDACALGRSNTPSADRKW